MIQIIVVYAIAAIVYKSTREEYPYYKALQMGLVNISSCALMWISTCYMVREFIVYMTQEDWKSIVAALLGCVMVSASIVFSISFLFFGDSVHPITQFLDDYKRISTDKTIPRISYSLFKKMRRLQPNYFKETVCNLIPERLACLKYHGKPYRLSFPDYILAMLYISREEKHNTKNNTTERELYAVMQADLEKQMDKISNEKKSALADVERATENTINIIGNMTRK